MKRRQSKAGQLAFDFDAATRARDQGLHRVEGGASNEWKDAALEAVYRTARAQAFLIVDDVWPNLQVEAETRDLRAMGPVMRRAASLGYIAATDRYELSDRITSHRNPRRVWQSLIWPTND